MNVEELKQALSNGSAVVLDKETNRWRARQQALISLLSKQALSEKEIREALIPHAKNQKYLQNTLYNFRKKGILVSVLVKGELKYMHKSFFEKLKECEQNK